MKIFRIILFFILVLFFMSLAGCSLYVRPCPPDLAAIQPKPAVRSTQAIVVTEEHFLFLTSTWIFALESINGQWHPSFPPMKAVIGRNGFAPDGEKREGDGKTPIRSVWPEDGLWLSTLRTNADVIPPGVGR